MRKILHFILFSARKYRCLMINLIIWLLRLLHDVETEEMWHNSDLLDSLDLETHAISFREYSAIEEDYLSCEYSISIIESVIEDLKCAY